MNHETLVACHARALAAAGHVGLPLRSRVWRGQAGEFQGAGSGSSLDFQDHRTYVPGDDPRHINWQAYARTGTYTMKLYREEVRPVVDVALDVSESMFFEPAKAARTAELFYLVLESARYAGVAARIHLVAGGATRALDHEAVLAHRWFDDARTLAADDRAAPPDLSRIPFRQNAIRVWISDLLFPGDPEPSLRLLAQRQGAPILLCPFAASEADPDWQGNCEFVDSERHTRHPHRVEPNVLRRYRDAYAAHFSFWKQVCRRHQSAFARVPAETDLQSSLFAEAVPSGALVCSG
jgi:uncharacterized protein (DUF58 family)